MKVTYTGKDESLTPEQRQKIEAKFAKLAKLLDAPWGEREAHVILTAERHIHQAEITVRYRDNHLVGYGAGSEILPAISDAVEKMEKQILKLREKRRDVKREANPEETTVREEELEPSTPASVEAEVASESGAAARVFRVNHHERRKPMTLEEALIAIDDRDYFVYRDSETDRISVLVRRRDGNFDLIEA